MTSVSAVSLFARQQPRQNRGNLAADITWAASKQTALTVRLLVDRDRVDNAYRAYGYFRWVDDRLDGDGLSAAERMAFVERQCALVERCYRGDWPQTVREEERLLVELIRSDRTPDSGLRSYIYHMMAVMAFDADRRGRLVSEVELNHYTNWLAIAVTEALHYFIGHDDGSPQNHLRYMAATGAHITHMLRDTLEDAEAGYINLPRETIDAGRIDPTNTGNSVYRAWVMGRVEAARACFRAGRAYLAQVKNLRCRLAGYAYIARFEGVLDAIEREGYRLRTDYPERKSVMAGLRMGWSTLSQAANLQYPVMAVRRLSAVEG